MLPLRASFSLLLSLAAAGCGDDDPTDDDGSGGGAAAPARAAWSVTLLDMPLDTCPIASHATSIGTVTSTMKDKLLEDGEDGAAVACDVTGSSPFAVQA